MKSPSQPVLHACLTAAWVLASSSRVLSAEPAPPRAPELEPVVRLMEEAVQNGTIASALHWVWRDGTLIHQHSAGGREPGGPDPFQPDTLVRIYSMSKPVVSVAAMVLMERGAFTLDDPVSKFLPAFSQARVLEKSGDSFRTVRPRRPMTLRDVLTHSTGYSYGEEPEVRAYYEREGMRYRGPGAMFPPRLTLAQAAEAKARIPALHHPGERFTYGFSTDLLGRLIEVWSGRPLDVALKETLLEPLDMQDTGFRVRDGATSRFAPCLELKDGTRTIIDPAATSPFNAGFEFLSGGGGLVSTANDYLQFCEMLVNGGQFRGKRILTPGTVGLMFTNQLAPGAGRPFGLGFDIRQVTLGRGPSARTATEHSWGGYANTAFRIVPSERLVQITIRQELPYSDAFEKRLFAEVYSRLPTTVEMESSRREARYWLENMLAVHRFTMTEAALVLGWTEAEVDAQAREWGLTTEPSPGAVPGGPVRIHPYPGGRHPRIGFLDGAIDPLRGTKLSLVPPWNDGGYVVLDLPEAIFSNLGLTYLAHTHIPTLWTREGIAIRNVDWTRGPDGSLESRWNLPNGIRFGATATPCPDGADFTLWLENGTASPLKELRTQICLLLKGAPGFAEQSPDRKEFANPLAVVSSMDGNRHILLAFERCGRAWGNPPCPCIHSDPVVPDAAPGQRVSVRGALRFHEGDDLAGARARLLSTLGISAP